MLKDAAPFLLGIVATLAQPAFDSVWQNRYEKVFEAEANILDQGAVWVSTMGAFLPTAMLTAVGTILLIRTNETDRALIIIVGTILVVLTLVLYFVEARRGNPSTRPRLVYYNHLQVWLVVLNTIGVGATFGLS